MALFASPYFILAPGNSTANIPYQILKGTLLADTFMNGKKAFFGIALILLGVLLLGRSANLFIFGFVDLLPFLFIGAGIWFIIRRRRQEETLRRHTESGSIHVNVTVDETPQSASTSQSYASPNDFAQTQQQTSGPSQTDFGGTRASQAPEQDSAGCLKYSKLIGDMFVDCSNCRLENIEVSGFLGDIEVNLSNGKLREGLNRLIISHFIGDVRILVPRDFEYFAQCSNFIGEIELGAKRTSGFSNNVETHSSDYESATSKLYISANSFLGDIRIILT